MGSMGIPLEFPRVPSFWKSGIVLIVVSKQRIEKLMNGCDVMHVDLGLEDEVAEIFSAPRLVPRARKISSY